MFRFFHHSMFCLTLSASVALVSCGGGGTSTPKTCPSGFEYCSNEDKKWKFWEFLKVTYLWNDELPTDINLDEFEDNNALMNAVRKLPEDPFSNVAIGFSNGGSQSKIAVRGTKVFEENGIRIGYLSYGAFDLGQETQLVNALNSLVDENLDEVIVDLRGNTGGFGSLGSHMGIAIMGDSVEGEELFHHDHNETLNNRQAFDDMWNNIQAGSVRDGRNQLNGQLGSVNFSSRRINNSMNIRHRVIFLTDEKTCSASELVINGFKPYVDDLVLIGTTTCGKPLSFLPTEICREVGNQIETFWSATFLISNRDGETNYFDGLAPTCEVEETRDLEPGDDDDAVIVEALKYITAGQCSE